MKNKPVFENQTKGKIQIMRRGIPIWLEPGDRVEGESYRVYMALGLTEVKKKEKRKLVVDDRGNKDAPIKTRPKITEDEKQKIKKLFLEDHVIPSDDLKISADTHAEVVVPTVSPEEEVKVEPVKTKPKVLTNSPPEVVEKEEEPVTEPGTEGEALMDKIAAELEAEMDPDDEPIVVMEDEEEKVDAIDNYPHKCDYDGCDRSFASRRGLKSHKRLHRS